MEERTFAEELDRSPIDLPRAALSLAREIAYTDLGVEDYLSRLDELAAGARRAIPAAGSPQATGERLAGHLFERLGFQGNQTQYNDPRNSYLNEVLDRRLGIPISLSVVFLAVADRIELPAHGVALPGHFIVGVGRPEEQHYLDPFHGGIRRSVQDCSELVRVSTGYRGAFLPEWLKPAEPRDILIRMLANLRAIYMQTEDWPHAVRVLERLRLAQPDETNHLRDLGFAHQHSGLLPQAINLYEQYLLRAPSAPDAEIVRRNLHLATRRLARLN